MGKHGRPIIERIEARVDQRGPEECWPWVGGVSGEKPVLSGTHSIQRRIFEHHFGKVPRSLAVKPSCGNMLCCNPAHLTLVTITQVQRERVRRWGSALFKDEAGFWALLDKSQGECWLWPAKVGDKGYGSAHYKGRRMYAHNAAWIMANGPIPDGQKVCHHCDNRRCCRPDHLFLGSAKENTDDMIAKGRHALVVIGRRVESEHHRHARILAHLDAERATAQRRVDMVEAYWQDGKSLSDLAAEYGQDPSTISKIVNGKRDGMNNRKTVRLWCNWCGERYEPTTKHQRYCSVECEQQYQWAMERARAGYER